MPDGEVVPIVDPPYQKTADFEKFDHEFWKIWVGQNWKLGLYIAGVYIATIFAIQRWMRNRQAFELRGPLILWNAGMALFSIIAVSRNFRNLLHVVTTEGFHHSVCYREGMTLTQQFWNFMVLWSKVVELGDTLFLVLRKKQLIFLHWYHHALIVSIVFYAYNTYDPVSRWYFVINTTIHSLMYTYYALRAAGYYVPKKLSIVLTRMQTLQFGSGFIFSTYSLYAISQGICERNAYDVLLLEIPIGVSFFILFGNYYIHTYKRGRKPDEKKE